MLPVTQLFSSAVILLEWRRWSLIYAKNGCWLPTACRMIPLHLEMAVTLVGAAERRKLEKEPREESRRVLTPVAKSKRVLSCNIVSLTAAREALEKAYLPPPPPAITTSTFHTGSFTWTSQLLLDLEKCLDCSRKISGLCWFVKLMLRANGPLTLTSVSYRADKDEHLAVKCVCVDDVRFFWAIIWSN